MAEIPLVSVVMITYNHENYIKQAIEGVLMQQCNFEVELIIADDCSPDATETIVKQLKYKHTNGNWIKYTKHIDNKGMIPNYIWALQQCKSKYIAMCEGDDYWIDPLKLQKQVQALEENPNVNICSHPTYEIINEKLSNQRIGYWGNEIKFFSFEEVLINFAGTAPFQTILIRNQDLNFYNELVSKALGGHSMTQIYFSYKNGLVYLPEIMSVYRVGSTSSISKILFKHDKDYLKRQLKGFTALDFLKENIDNKYQSAFEETKRRLAIQWIGTSFTSTFQNLYLISKFKLYKSLKSLIRSIKFNYEFKLKRFGKRIKDKLT